MNPFETSFESDGPTPRVSFTMDDKAVVVEPEGGTTVAGVLDASMTRDSSMSSSYDNMAENMADKMADNDHVVRSDRSPSSFDVADTLNNEAAEAMTKSCDSITTLQEVLEDYESVMSGI